MKRVHVICEGLTELTFVGQLLQPAFPHLRLIALEPGKTFGWARGGDIKYDRVKPDIVRTLKHDRECYCTTFLDYYARVGFPEKEEPHGQTPESKAARIECAVAEDVAGELGESFDRSRFYPYFSMHEFEGLLLSDPQKLAEGIYQPDLSAALRETRSAFDSPEHIDDGQQTAPSKRLKQACSRYDKVTGGNIAALGVGLDAMRRECAHFNRWLKWFETLQR
jgi:hypothetical protein